MASQRTLPMIIHIVMTAPSAGEPGGHCILRIHTAESGHEERIQYTGYKNKNDNDRRLQKGGRLERTYRAWSAKMSTFAKSIQKLQARKTQCFQLHHQKTKTHSSGYGGEGKSTDIQLHDASVTAAICGPWKRKEKKEKKVNHVIKRASTAQFYQFIWGS